MKTRAINKVDKAARKQRMLEAALDAFFEKGYAAARMDDIAQRCQLSKGTLYLYFDSKEDLFNGLIETVAVPNLRQVEQMMAQSDSVEKALKKLIGFMPGMIKNSQMPRLIKILIADAGVFPEIIREYRKQVIDHVIDSIEGVIQRGNDRGETQIANPAMFGRLVVAPVLFSAVWKAVFTQPDESEFNFDALFRMHQDIVLNVLKIPLGASYEKT